ncbi:hypothetical protein ACHAQJ_005155 [Trichoderma viride]
MAYLAEEELYGLDETTKLTIAPGCVGSRAVNGLEKRCAFDELALYIWAPKRNKPTKKPSGYQPKTSTGIKGLPNPDAQSAFNKLIGKIGNAKFNTDEHLDGEVDVSKLMPGKSDFYDALSSIGDPIGALAVEVDKREKENKPDGSPTFTASKDQKNIIKWGQETAFYVSALRGKDQDTLKDGSEDAESKKLNIITMEVETPKQDKIKEDKGEGKEGKGKYEWKPQTLTMINFDATIEANAPEIEDFKKMFADANEKFMEMEKEIGGKKEKFNAAHKKAYAAAKMALAATGCTKTLPRDLKKRNPLDEPALRSPKAAKSMRVKARKLGFTV